MDHSILFANYATISNFELSVVQSCYNQKKYEPPHTHEFYELVLVESGNGYHIFMDEKYEIGAGNIFLIKPQQVHAYESIDNLTLVSIIFFPSILDPLIRDFNDLPGFQLLFNVEPMFDAKQRHAGKLRINEEILPVAIEITETMQYEFKNQKNGFKIACINCFWELLLLISRNCKIADDFKFHYAPKIGLVLSYMEKHFKDNINLTLLAQVAGMSVRTFRRRFIEAQKVSPITYLLHLRLKKAAIMMRSSTFMISEISGECGFHDSNYFSHQFTKIYKMSPNRYRKNRLDNYFLNSNAKF